jgi:hypothetical protein
MNGNVADVISEDSALGASDFVADKSPPKLEYFDIDINTGDLSLTFSGWLPAAIVMLISTGMARLHLPF